MSTSVWLDKSSEKTRTADVVIVGGGISGVSTAFWLKKEDPSLEVVIVEKNRLGFGATGRNAGFITCGSVEHFNRLVERWGRERAGAIWQFSEDNLSLLKEHIIQNDQNLGFDDKGTFSLASTEEEFTELKATTEIMKSFDIPVEVVNGSDIESRVGAINFVGGIKYLKDASVNPMKMLEKMYQLSGAELLEGVEVYDVLPSGDGSVTVKTDKVEINAPIVVMATNGYSAQLMPYFADKIYPTRGQIMVTEPVEKFMEGPCYANFVLDYFRQLEDGRVIIGGFRQLEKDTEVGYSDHITEVIQEALHKFLVTYIPRLKQAKITHRWSGVMGFSADGQPMVGSMPDNPQVYFVGGHTAHGLGLAFHCGKSVTDLLFDRPIPDFISARRF